MTPTHVAKLNDPHFDCQGKGIVAHELGATRHEPPGGQRPTRTCTRCKGTGKARAAFSREMYRCGLADVVVLEGDQRLDEIIGVFIRVKYGPENKKGERHMIVLQHCVDRVAFESMRILSHRTGAIWVWLTGEENAHCSDLEEEAT